MKRIMLLTCVVAWLCSCGNNNEGGPGSSTAPTNTTVGTANGGNTYGGGDSTNLNGGNATGQAADSSNGKANQHSNSSQGGDSSTQHR